MNRLLLPLVLALSSTSVEAKDRATFRYTPPQGDERPVITEAVVGAQGNDFALRLTFNKPPFGAECGTRCASATVLIDTDATASSGMKLSGKEPENGADLAIIVQGTRDLTGVGRDNYLRVKVRRLTNEAHTVDDGELLADLDHRKDPERVHVEGNTVFLLIEASAELPSSRKSRVVYHPPGGKAIKASIPGMIGSGGRSKVMIFRRGGWGQAPKDDTIVPGVPGPSK
ncbi:MAG: hypothetical protein ABW123_11240 [Cystobacter sp.]